MYTHEKNNRVHTRCEIVRCNRKQSQSVAGDTKLIFQKQASKLLHGRACGSAANAHVYGITRRSNCLPIRLPRSVEDRKTWNSVSVRELGPFSARTVTFPNMARFFRLAGQILSVLGLTRWRGRGPESMGFKKCAALAILKQCTSVLVGSPNFSKYNFCPVHSQADFPTNLQACSFNSPQECKVRLLSPVSVCALSVSSCTRTGNLATQSTLSSWLSSQTIVFVRPVVNCRLVQVPVSSVVRT